MSSYAQFLPAVDAHPPRNRAPIALVGGFTNWGREELFGFHYWGGRHRDIQEDLKAHGFETHTVAVGPFSSNWDRACEAFAILHGGRVDYGKAHAERHGHARFGRTYPGLLNAWDAEHRIHLVGHSQGGQTVRVLSHLLAMGDEAERTATPPEELSPLFAGLHPWVLSLTTLSTPHDGTTLVYRREGLVDPARRLLSLGASLGHVRRAPVYDAKLDQWSLKRHDGESFKDYSTRLFQAPLWRGTRDFSAWDLSPEGALELNHWARVQPNVYHFSWSTAKTRPSAKGHHKPAPRMMPLYHLGSRYMGSALRKEPVLIDASWWQNDGVVNTRSMAGPSTEVVQSFQDTPLRGIWNHMGILEGWDHSEILGIGLEHGEEVLDFYRRWAAFLSSLEWP